MTHHEFQKLRRLERSARAYHSFSRTIPSRRSAKSKGNAIGQILKHSRVRSEVSLERDYNPLSRRKQ